LDFKDVVVLDSLNPLETDSPVEEPVRAGLPTYDVNRSLITHSHRMISWEYLEDLSTGQRNTLDLVFSICIRTH
jgi:hypothetical protein